MYAPEGWKHHGSSSLHRGLECGVAAGRNNTAQLRCIQKKCVHICVMSLSLSTIIVICGLRSKFFFIIIVFFHLTKQVTLGWAP